MTQGSGQQVNSTLTFYGNYAKTTCQMTVRHIIAKIQRNLGETEKLVQWSVWFVNEQRKARLEPGFYQQKLLDESKSFI